MIHLKNTFNLLKDAAKQYARDRGSMLAAALAYYTLFSLAPLLVISIALAERFLSDTNVQLQLISRLRVLAGSEVSEFVRSLIQGFGQSSTGLVASLFSIGVMIYGGSNVFRQLKRTLNTVWGVRVEDNQGIVKFIKLNLLSFGLVLLVGALLLTAIAMNALGGTLEAVARGLLNTSFQLSFFFEYVIPFALMVSLFALLFKILPDVEVSWRDVWLGALMTAVLMGIVLVVLRLYLAFSSFGAAYGAAGSLVVLLFIVYNGGQIFLLGAEFTQVYANQYGSRSKRVVEEKPSSPDAAAPVE